MPLRVALVIVLALVLAGCTIHGHGSATPAAPTASATKLRVLRESFANPRSFRLAGSIAEVSRRLPIARVRPDAALASDASIDSIWTSNGRTPRQMRIVVLWKSGVVETIGRWSCNCEPTAALRRMGHQKPFRFLMLRGAPAVTDASNPGQRAQHIIGPVAPAEAAYGAPASVETIRNGYNVTLFQYGAHTQAGLITAAQTLPVAHAAFQVRGYAAGGAALGNWNGHHGINVAPHGGARFGIGVTLKNNTGRPLTITGANAINGFIRLIGIHVRPYTPPVGDAIGPPIVHAPYDGTPRLLDYELPPHTWVGMQLDYQVQDPCITWSQTIYDRTVEVTYTQGDGNVQVQDVPMVPLNVTRHHAC